MKIYFCLFRELFYFALFFLFGLAVPHGLWDLSSQPTRNWTQAPCSEAWSLNHWTAREFRELIYISVYVFIIQKQKNCSLNSDKWIPVRKFFYVKGACISLGYWWGFRGLGSRDDGGDNLHAMNPHTGCLLKDGVGYFFWNLKQEVGTCSSCL